MLTALFATALVAALGHFIIRLCVRHLDPQKALRAYWMTVGAGLLVIASSGCGSSLGFGGPSKARPNRPGWVMGEFHTQDPVTGERRYVSLTGQGSENSDTPMVATATKDGVTFNSGTSAPFKWTSVTSNPIALFGCLLIVGAVGLFIAGRAGFPVPVGAVVPCVIAGVGLLAFPFVMEALKPVIIIGVPVVGIGFAIYYGKKLKWFEKATDTDAVFARLRKGDVKGAAALAYLGQKGSELGKARATDIQKNGSGVVAAAPAPPIVSPASVTAGPTAPAAFTHVSVPPMPTVPPMPVVEDPTQPPA